MDRWFKTLSDYGPKLLLFIGLAFSTYMRFILVENDVIDIHDRLNKKIKIITDQEERIKENEKIIYHLQIEVNDLKKRVNE